MLTIVDVKREFDQEYKKSGIQHFLNDLYHGTDRLNCDVRPVAGSDAFFGSYDYFGSNIDQTETNPPAGPYWRMQHLDSMKEFLDNNREYRTKKIKEMNKKNPGVNQERVASKSDEILKMASIFEEATMVP